MIKPDGMQKMVISTYLSISGIFTRHDILISIIYSVSVYMEQTGNLMFQFITKKLKFQYHTTVV